MNNTDPEYSRDVLPIHAAPVAPDERFASLDMLRGVAILGILVMNIYAFAMPFGAYGNPLLMGGSDSLNLGVWFFTHVLAEQKFISIFAMMFGAGMVLMTDRAEAKGAKPAPIYYRRQFWLVIIGAVHGYLIWFGDILFTYALIGMLVYPFRRRSPKFLLIGAMLLLSVTPLFYYGTYVHMSGLRSQAEEIVALEDGGQVLTEEQQGVIDEWEASRSMMVPNSEDTQEELDVYSGSYADILAHRAPLVVTMQIFSVFFYGIWRIGGLMLVGIALMKLGVLTGQRSRGFYRRLMLAGYILGLPLTIFSATDLFAHRFDGLYMMRVGALPNYFGSVLMALGHVGLVMLLAVTGTLRRLMGRFAAVGRMALTNYLMHSVILTTVFYGYGLGLYGQVPRIWQMAIVAAVIGFQLIVSSWWLGRFRFGPVEWLWRSLTYWERQPMRQST